MATLGSVLMDQSLEDVEKGVKVLVWVDRRWERDVQVWPWAGTNWRGSC